MNFKNIKKISERIFVAIIVFTVFVSNISVGSINILISKFNDRKIVDSLWLSQNDSNVVDISFSDKAEAATVSQYVGGLLVYADGTVGTPKYRTFNDTTGFDTEQSASSVGSSAIEWIRVAASPTADEWIIVTRDAGDVIKAQVCTGVTGGVSCGTPTTISATAGTHGFRNFDVAYEQTSGDALLVYGTSTVDQLKKIEWTGGVWTNDAAITTTRTSGTVEWVELTSKNNSNEIGIAYSDTNDDVSAYKWSGTAVGNEATAVITLTASTGDVRKFDVSFEGASGDMLVMAWVQGAGTAATGQLVGTTWTIGTQTGVDMLTGFVDLQEPSPSSNYIVASSHGAAASANPSEGFAWNGTGVTDGTAADDVVQNWAANYQLSAVQYFSSSTYYAVGVISNAATPDDIDWWTSSSAGALTNQTVNARTRGSSHFVDIFDYPNTNKVLLLTSDANSDLWADTWAGAAVTSTAWTDLTSGGALETALSSATTDVYDFAFRLSALLEIPTVTTQAVSNIDATTATGNGNITVTGGQNNTKRGFVYGTSPQSLPGNVAPASSGYTSYAEDTGSFPAGAFTKDLSGLTLGLTYYARAYSYNSIGYSYGDEVTFTTVVAPKNITISSSATTCTGSPNFTTSTSSCNVLNTDIQSLVNAGTSVSFTATNGDITVSNAVAKTSGADVTMSMYATENIIINADITSTVGKLGLLLNSDRDADSSGYINIVGNLTSLAGNITLGGGGGTISAGSGFAVGKSGQVIGVYVNNKTIAAGGGNIIINGQGHNAITNNNIGVYVTGATGAITTTGTGTINITGNAKGITNSSADYGLYVYGGGIISTVNGNLTINATGGGAGTGTDNDGVYVAGTNSTIKTTGSGILSITGTGGNVSGSGSANYGVYCAIANCIQTTGTGALSITGTGGNGSGSGNQNHGVYLTSGSITGNGGLMTINGSAGNSSSGTNDGIFLSTSTSAISNTGSGAINITATGGVGANSSDNHGLYVYGGGIISTVNGNLTVTGTGGGNGTGITNHGVYIVFTNSTIKTTGSGNLIINGIKGSGASSAGVRTVIANALQTTTSGNITVNTDTIFLTEASDINSINSLAIAPYTAGGTIGVAGGSGTLVLDSTTLGYLTYGTGLTIGSTSQTGATTVGTYTGWVKPVTFTHNTTGSINITGAQTSTSSFNFDGPTTLSADITASAVTLSSGTFNAGAQNINLTGTGNVFNYSGGTFNAGTSTIKLTNTSATAKTFAGGGQVYGNIWIAGAGTGTYTFSGNNTFSDFKVDTPPHTILFTAGSTTTISTLTAAGLAGSLNIFKSTVDGSFWNISKLSGAISSDYLSLRDSHAIGGALFFAGANSTNVSGNTGWVFTALSCMATTTGFWNTGSNWTGCNGVGGLPLSGESVIINSGITTTLDINTPAVNTLTINGVLTTMNSGTSYTINANSINIGATGTLYANNSTINLSATTGTAFMKTGVFDAGASSVNMVGGQDWTERTTSAGVGYWVGVASSSDGTKLATANSNNGYIYTSTDSGATWTQRTNSGARHWIGITSSSDGTKLAAIIGNAWTGYIYTSTDSGATWTQQTNSGLRDWGSITSSSDGTKLAAGTTYGYIYTSTDSGATWTERTSSGTRTWRRIASSSDGTKLVAGDNGFGYIYTSTDSGATWTQRTTSGMRYWNGIASSSDGTKLAAADDNGGYIYTSTDSGVNWTQRISSGSHWWYGITSSSDGTKLAAIDNNNGYIYTSIDSGVTWSEKTTSGARSWFSITSSSDGTKLAAGAYGYIYTSTSPQDIILTSGAPSFYNLSITGSGTRTLGEALTVSNTLTAIGGTLDTTSANNYTVNSGNILINGGTFTPNASTVNLTGTSGTLFTKSGGTFNAGTGTVNAVGGVDWVERNSMGLTVWYDIVSSSDGARLAAVGYNGYIYTSTDFGTTWTQRTSAGQRYWNGIASSSDGTKLAAVVNGTAGYIYTSTDSGATWTERTSAGLLKWYKITSSNNGVNLAAIVDGGYIYTSTDSGTTWTERTSAGSRNWRGIASSSDGIKLVVVGNMADIYTSTDGGVTWVNRYNSKYWTDVTSSSDGTKLAATAIASSYIYTSTDSGATWTERTNSGAYHWYDIASSSDGVKLAAIVVDGHIYTSTDSGINWVEQVSAGQRSWKTISSSSDGTRLAVGDYRGATGGYIYTYSAPQNATISSGSPSFNNLTISGTGTRSLDEDFIATGTLTVSGGTLDTDYASNYTVNTGKVLINGGTFNANTSDINLTGTSGTLFTKSSGIFNEGSSSVVLASASGTPIVASGVSSFNNLYTLGAGTFKLGEALNVNNILTITGGILDTNSTSNYTVNTGKILINGGTFTPNASTINLNGVSGTLFTKSSGTFEYGASTVNTVGGHDWIAQTSSGSRLWNCISSSSDGKKLAACVTGGYIYTSNDSGATWTERTNSGQRNWYSVASSSDGTKLAAVVRDGYIYTSTDSGITWTERTSVGSRQWVNVVSSSDGIKLAATAGDAYVYISADSGVTWTPKTSAGFGAMNGISISSDGTKLAAGVNGTSFFTSSNSGDTWTLRDNAGSHYWNKIASSSDGVKIVAASNPGYIYTSTDSGATWTERISSGSRSWSGVSSSSDGTILAASDVAGYLYLSTDSGATWTEQVSAGILTWKGVTLSSDGAKLYASTFGNYIYEFFAPQNATISSGNPSFYNLTISGTGTRTIEAAVQQFIYGVFDIKGGTFDLGGTQLNLNGSSSSPFATPTGGGIFNAGVGSVRYGGSNPSGDVIVESSVDYYRLEINGSGETFVPNGTINASSQVYVQGGTLDTTSSNSYPINTQGLSFWTGSLVANNSLISLSGSGGAVVSYGHTLGTFIAGTSTIKLTDASINPKIFEGNNQTYNNLWFAPGAGTGSLTITGNNTFNNFKDDGTAAHSILFTTGSTQTVSSWDVSGTAGNIITINSTDTGTHNLIMANGGYADVDYLNIQHSVATPTNTWYAGTHSVNNQAVATAGSGWVFTVKPLIKIYTQSGFRLFNNIDTADIITPLALTNTTATLNKSGDNFRLRALIHVGGSNLPINFQNFKLQYAQMSGACDIAFSGESYSDVTNDTDISYYDNFYPEDKAVLIANANDPTHNADTIVNQSYVESNNFTNSIAEIPMNQDGKWDFSLYDKSVANNVSYCLRVVKSDGGLLDNYSFIPEIITALYRSRGGGSGNVESSVTPNTPTGGGTGQGSGGGNTVLPKCSDTIDNDGDTLIDTLDPNCHVGDNLGNPYLPNYDSESPVITPCTVNCSGGGGTGDLGYNKNIFNSIFNILRLKSLRSSLLGLVFNPFKIQ